MSAARKLEDEFSTLPDAAKRWRARLRKSGLCNRCGQERAEAGVAYGPICRAYFKNRQKKRPQ